MLRRSVFVACALAVATVLLAACEIDTDGSEGSAPRPRDADAVVTIADISFSPSTVEIDAAQTVAWVWDDGFVAHDVVFDDGPASPQQGDGTWERRFEESGTYDYACTIHPQMTGTVVVT